MIRSCVFGGSVTPGPPLGLIGAGKREYRTAIDLNPSDSLGPIGRCAQLLNTLSKITQRNEFQE